MVHGRHGTWEIWYTAMWYMGDTHMGDMVHGRYGTWEIWYMEDMEHGRYLYMGDIVHGRYDT